MAIFLYYILKHKRDIKATKTKKLRKYSEKKKKKLVKRIKKKVRQRN